MLKELDKKALIKYFRSLGLEVNTSTAARGHQGFFLKNRIDVSKNVAEERFIPTLLHEFAHFIHPNHSKAFWDFVTMMMPDWKERRKGLEQ